MFCVVLLKVLLVLEGVQNGSSDVLDERRSVEAELVQFAALEVETEAEAEVLTASVERIS